MELQRKRIGGTDILLRDSKSLTSAALHFSGVLLAFWGLILLMASAGNQAEDLLEIISYLVFGVSLIALYGASTAYHVFYISEPVHNILRKLDHIMIFFLIAGTYTPLCLITLQGPIGWVLFGLVWGISIVGTIMKVFWIAAPRWLSALIYVLLGWMIVFAFVPLSRSLPTGGIISLVTGGIIYTIGAILYAKKVELFSSKWFGNHELFHIFVLLGSCCHYWMVLRYVSV